MLPPAHPVVKTRQTYIRKNLKCTWRNLKLACIFPDFQINVEAIQTQTDNIHSGTSRSSCKILKFVRWFFTLTFFDQKYRNCHSRNSLSSSKWAVRRLYINCNTSTTKKTISFLFWPQSHSNTLTSLHPRFRVANFPSSFPKHAKTSSLSRH